MDPALDRFVKSLPNPIAMDYSIASLGLLEDFLIKKYPDAKSALLPSEGEIVDGAARYLGEVFRVRLGGGSWFIDYRDEKNAYFGLPQLRDVPGQKVQICPHTLVTTAIDRRTGTFLANIFFNLKKNIDRVS
jgi:hypothetical protein